MPQVGISLVKFSRDRKRWCYGLFQAQKHYGLCVLSYIVTSNHIHLLVLDTDTNVIPKSMQLIAGRTAQEYNQRKKRKGAYWEDRYFAMSIDTDEYHEIQSPPKRYRLIDRVTLASLLGLNDQRTYKPVIKSG